MTGEQLCVYSFRTVLFLFKCMHYLLGDGLLGGDREKPFGGMHGKKKFRRASRGGVYGIRVFAHKLTKQGGEARKQAWGAYT